MSENLFPRELTLAQELLWKRKWWWDPVPFELFKELEIIEQKDVILKTLEANAAISQIQTDTLKSLAALVEASQRCAEK